MLSRTHVYSCQVLPETRLLICQQSVNSLHQSALCRLWWSEWSMMSVPPPWACPFKGPTRTQPIRCTLLIHALHALLLLACHKKAVRDKAQFRVWYECKCEAYWENARAFSGLLTAASRYLPSQTYRLCMRRISVSLVNSACPFAAEEGTRLDAMCGCSKCCVSIRHPHYGRKGPDCGGFRAASEADVDCTAQEDISVQPAAGYSGLPGCLCCG